MAITRKVDTDVYCDICGKWVIMCNDLYIIAMPDP